jgi:hypothetical protein
MGEWDYQMNTTLYGGVGVSNDRIQHCMGEWELTTKTYLATLNSSKQYSNEDTTEKS